MRPVTPEPQRVAAAWDLLITGCAHRAWRSGHGGELLQAIEQARADCAIAPLGGRTRATTAEYGTQTCTFAYYLLTVRLTATVLLVDPLGQHRLARALSRWSQIDARHRQEQPSDTPSAGGP